MLMTLLNAAAISTSELHFKVNEDLENIRNWLLSNKLSLNVAKTEFMFFGTVFRLSNLGKIFPITIGEKEIKRVKSTKYLGVYLDENLTWDEHIDKLCSKVNRSISGLRHARDYMSLDILKMMYNALIQPVFDYCDAVWGNLNKGLVSKIQKLQNRAARIITFQGYDVRSADILEHLNWDNLALRRDKRLSILMYDTINCRVPKYLSDLFSLNCENNPYKSRLRENANNVSMSYIPKTEYYKASFSYRGGKNWNSLPLDLKTAKSKTIFKNKLLTRYKASASTS